MRIAIYRPALWEDCCKTQGTQIPVFWVLHESFPHTAAGARVMQASEQDTPRDEGMTANCPKGKGVPKGSPAYVWGSVPRDRLWAVSRLCEPMPDLNTFRTPHMEHSTPVTPLV